MERQAPAAVVNRAGPGGARIARPHRTGWSAVRLVTLALVLVLLVAYLAISGRAALTLTHAERPPFQLSPDVYGLAYETVRFPSRSEGLMLDGWLLEPAQPGRGRPVVALHGINSDRQREAGGRLLEIAAHFAGQGRVVLLFDLRGQGRSEGAYFTLGAKETGDVAGAIDYLERRGVAAGGVNLLGYSMGAASAMLEAPDDPRARAVVEDSGYAVLSEVLEVQIPKRGRRPPLFTPGTILMARWLVGFDAYAVRPLDRMNELAARGVPLLVIHGEADDLVPISHGRQLAAAYGPGAQTYFVPGAAHVQSYLADPATYLSIVDRFFDETE